MWFDPGALLKNKTASPLANPANPANYEPENSKTAPLISKLAELAEPFEYENAVIEVKPALIKCHDCLHFKCFNQHGRGAGHCLVGGDYGLWSETLHQCEMFERIYATDAITPGP
jgi:hypothetical protein